MSKNRATPFPCLALLFLALSPGMQPVFADVNEECRQEVQDYGIDPETASQYIRDCLLTRGGYLPDDDLPVDDSVPVQDEQMSVDAESSSL